jgi:hypothetical protein
MDIKSGHDVEVALAEIKDKLPGIALAMHMYYLALVKQGFTDEQAMHLVAEHGLTFGAKN